MSLKFYAFNSDSPFKLEHLNVLSSHLWLGYTEALGGDPLRSEDVVFHLCTVFSLPSMVPST